MPPTQQELSLLINPLVPESVQHNNRVLSQTHSLTSFLLGLSAGILGLQSTNGFLFYLLGTIFVSGLFHVFLIGPAGGAGAGAYFPGSSGGEVEGMDGQGKLHTGVMQTATGVGKRKVVARRGAWRDVWFGGGVMGEALSGFVLGWAGVGGVLR
ncbi:hypothetical protein VTN00DRAFT_7844 [Thermoascus crustaceus]|uniref:uncharacterized protein n=1 Tax=Thermoascus crustaceus TaxID=5088 RepID=UPI003743B63F